jgi:hypothetical protein
MLIRRRIQVGNGLARGLLHKLPRIVSDTVLYTVVIYSVGCIIPTPLDRAPASTNNRPVFVTDQVNPTFGFITHPQFDAFPITIVVDDPDDQESTSQDDLFTRLFLQDLTTGNLGYTGEEIGLSPASVPDPMHPTLRYGSFNAVPRCQGRAGTTQYLYAIVSDRKFSTTDPTKPASDAGLTDTNHWELSCTN